ncbi:MAG: hypothetical protein ETSY1_20175 [Candidatus Entotheonella factor]|uniref:DUF1800 domain-containing protein n=1 Tax=Entotheonella factor TaxID=1429438 RepID=W4LJJ8_ENTF1|nr:MAG: hypothetical protein ETSY1_20175 [Candidatus Entotheonella factor]
MFQFFAADEVDADGEQVIEAMMQSYFDSGYQTRAVLRTLFNSDYFKSDKARYARVKGPIELVVGAVRMAGSYQSPTFGADQLARQSFYMGQGLLQPPSVEGWHEGPEWIDSGALVERVNFVSKEMGNVMNPGVRSIINRLASEGGSLTSEALVDQCLDLIGPLEVSDATREILVEFANKQGEVNLEGHEPGDDAEQKVGDMLRLMTATREFQLA